MPFMRWDDDPYYEDYPDEPFCIECNDDGWIVLDDHAELCKCQQARELEDIEEFVS